MASSEIESASPAPGSQPVGHTVFDVFSAAAYGDFENLRLFVERDGASVSNPDASGYYALQWAALNNFPDIVLYIVEHGGDVNARDQMEQTALHWAAVRGGISVADVLLQNGAQVEASDKNGYRAVHVAAQYGQAAFLNHIVAKYHADFNSPDNEGRTPLHWAAYKGFADAVRLLLFRDACSSKQDKEGCTPLHWAAMKGNAEACTVLVHAGTKKELTMKDKSGFTPFQLAYDKGHRNIAFLISNVQKAQKNWCRDKVFGGKIIKSGYASILFCIILFPTILFMNSVLAASNLPKITAIVGLWGWAAVSFSVGSMIMLYKCSSKDPGYIERQSESRDSTDTVDPLLKIDMNSSSEWTGNWSQLCPTCKIIRPIRAKHCPTCNRCVEQFDHHCPWISNCVGKKNRRDFFILVCFGTLTSLISSIVTAQRIWTAVTPLSVGEIWIHGVMVNYPGAVTFFLVDIVIVIIVTTLTIAQASQIARNITTNESANATRYGYLRGPDGKFRNPYDHGFRKNCWDFFIRGDTDDEEIAWIPLQQVSM